MPDDLDDLSGIPRYLQVAWVVEAEIRAGQWTPGNAVPSRNQLAERFGLARVTAARAHAWLARSGYLVAVPGVGSLAAGPHRVGKPLKLGLEGLHSARRGDYRVIYRIDDERRLVIVLAIEHRSDIYRPRGL